MPPTISPLFRLRLSALGEDLNTWGDPNLNNAFKLVEEAVAGPLTLTITGSRTLTADNYISNEYRRGTHALVAGVGLAAPFTLTVPPIAYVYRIDNRTAFAATLKTSGGVGAVVRPGMISAVFCDGTDCKVADPTLDQVKTAAASVALGGNKLTGVGTATNATDATTLTNRIEQFTAPTGPLPMNAQKITGLANGTDPQDAATRGQIDSLTAASVQLASDWAQKTSSTVDGTEYSAKLWATSTTALTGGNKGAKGYAQDAASSASAASGSASAASGSAGTASGAATAAGTSATAADASATLAGKYADNPEDSPVVTTPSPRYSAFHWSRKAQASIGGAKVTTSDTTPAPLATKIVRPDGSAYSVANPGADERLQVGVLGAYQEFLTSGTWTKPTGATWVYVEVVAGGGGATNTTAANDLGGGGGGSFNFKTLRAADITATVAVTIGAGGSGGATGSNSSGSPGGASTFGAYCVSAPGKASISAIGGSGGAGELGGDTSSLPAVSGFASAGGGSSVFPGGNSIKGGAGGGGVNSSNVVKLSGTSTDGGNGGAGNATANQKGGNGSVPGGGGGASTNNGGGGDGGAGRIRVWAW